MATLREPFALDRSLNTTESPSRNIADVLAEELGRLGSKTASDVMYDNTDSGLVAENVQDALDEINGKVVQSNWEQADPTADDYIKNKPTTDLQTAVDTFSTLTGGLLSEAKLTLAPVQSGSGTPSPDNVRPISGHTEARLDDDGFNRWNEEWELGAYNTSTGAPIASSTQIRSKSTSPVRVTPNTEYCFTNKGARISQICWYDADDNFISNTPNPSDSVFVTTSPNNAYLVRFQCPTAYGTTYNNDICVNVSDSRNGQYEPYLGKSYVTPLGTTIYMANIDMVSGGADNLTAEVVMNGSESWNIHPAISHGFYCDNVIPTGLVMDSTKDDTAISEMYTQNRYDVATSMDDGRFAYGLTGGTVRRFILRDDRFDTVAELTTALASNNLKLVMNLATPQHIQLSPQLIQTLVGENNLSAPLEGQTIDEVKYRQVFTFEDVVNYINGQGA